MGGRYQPQSEDVALDFFICAAERGHDDAMVAAGDIYYQREQWKEAKKYYKMASDLGNELGTQRLALAKLQTAEGDLQCQYARSLEDTNMAEAVIWYAEGADQGHAESAYRLGKFFMEGVDDIPANEDKGLMSLLQAAGSGHTAATLMLAEYYENKGMYDTALQKLQECPHKNSEVKAKIEELKQKQ